MKKVIALLLALMILLSGCGAEKAVQSGEDLMKAIRPAQVAINEEGVDGAAQMDFGLRLLQESCEAGKNTLSSPLSVPYALSM